MKHLRIAIGLSMVAIFLTPTAGAEVFKCLNADGKVTYSEKKEANAQCTPVTTPINVVPAGSVTAPASKSEKESERSGIKNTLREQIAEQERALVEAKKALAEQENIRLGGEKNYQRVLDRLKPYQDKITEIEKKLAQLREEQAKAK